MVISISNNIVLEFVLRGTPNLLMENSAEKPAGNYGFYSHNYGLNHHVIAGKSTSKNSHGHVQVRKL